MSLISSSQIKGIKNFAKDILKQGLSNDLSYYNWPNTKDNIETVEMLIERSKLPVDDAHMVKAATYFLYTGFSKLDTENHFQESKNIATEYLQKNQFPSVFVQGVNDCLQLTIDRNLEPKGKAQKVFHDVFYSVYGQKKLHKRIEASWEELNLLGAEKEDILTVMETTYTHMNDHEFHTPCAKRKFRFRKLKNGIKLQSYIDKVRSKNMLSSNKTAMTMFKTALRNHIDLVNIADKKAGIMISINAILMTVMIPILGSYILDVSKYIIPSVILLLTCGAAVILATMATRPQRSDGKIDENEKLAGNKSLFYFGNFFKMGKNEYQNAIKDVIVRDKILENSVINDLYEMGVLLGIKYRRLRWCYIVFAVGIGLTLLSFLFSFFLFSEI